MNTEQSGKVGNQGPLRLEQFGDLAPLREALQRASFTAPAVARTFSVRSLPEGVNLPVVCVGPGANRIQHAFSDVHSVERRCHLGGPGIEPHAAGEIDSGRAVRAGAENLPSIGRLVAFESLYCLSDSPRVETSRPESVGRFAGGCIPQRCVNGNPPGRAAGGDHLDAGTGCGIDTFWPQLMPPRSWGAISTCARFTWPPSTRG